MKIVIVGGGTAGWISALLARRYMSGVPIVVVESPEIGILGAGEGTTPHFIGDFLDFVGIPMSDLVKHCGATFKNAIRFVNWRGDGSHYFHTFLDKVTKDFELPMLHPQQPLPDDVLDFSAHVSNRAKSLFSPRTTEFDPRANPLARYQNHGAFAAHFDAVRLAGFLKQVALSRNIEHVEDTVVGVIPNPNGDIDRLRLRDHGSLSGSLFIDCTGFRRVLVGGHFGVPLVDVSQTLPVDRALPFSLPLDGPRAPYTEAIALDAGWMWKIPVEGRYGCGYVFDSAFATDDEARATVRREFGDDVDLPKVLRFKAGYLERVWVKNCVAVGLSSGFLEPLEATSIWTSIIQLRELFRVHLAQSDDRAHDEFNAFNRLLQERIVEFLYLHYLGDRSDTPFWQTFQQRTKAPPVCAEILQRGGYRWPFDEDPRIAGHPAPFPAVSWLWVAKGLGLIDQPSIARYWDYYALHDGYEDRARDHHSRLQAIGDACVDHEVLLERLAR